MPLQWPPFDFDLRLCRPDGTLRAHLEQLDAHPLEEGPGRVPAEEGEGVRVGHAG